MKWALHCPSWLLGDGFQATVQGRKPGRLPELGRWSWQSGGPMQPEFTGQGVRRKRGGARDRTPESCRGSLSDLIRTSLCGNSSRPGKGPPKELGGNPWVHTGPDTVPVSTSQNGNPITTGRGAECPAGSCPTVRNDQHRLGTALGLPNKVYKQDPKGSNCFQVTATPRTELRNVCSSINIPSTQQVKIHNVWHPVKVYQACREAGRSDP